MWIGTKRGLNKLDKKTGRFTVVNHRFPGSPVNDLFVYGLAVDESSVISIHHRTYQCSILKRETWRLSAAGSGMKGPCMISDIHAPEQRRTDLDRFNTRTWLF